MLKFFSSGRPGPSPSQIAAPACETDATAEDWAPRILLDYEDEALALVRFAVSIAERDEFDLPSEDARRLYEQMCAASRRRPESWVKVGAALRGLAGGPSRKRRVVDGKERGVFHISKRFRTLANDETCTACGRPTIGREHAATTPEPCRDHAGTLPRAGLRSVG